jgi:PAS domain S-box-containing protein
MASKPEKTENPASHPSPTGSCATAYRRMVEIRDYAAFPPDTEGHVASWARGRAHKGYKPEEIIGRYLHVLSSPRSIGLAAARLRPLRGWATSRTRAGVRKDGGLFWANVVITAIRNPDGQLLGFSKITRDSPSGARTRRGCA